MAPLKACMPPLVAPTNYREKTNIKFTMKRSKKGQFITLIYVKKGIKSTPKWWKIGKTIYR